jgi:hypothetical protein
MLSTDLADLYAVEPRVLIQAVKRNRERFPADFMFQLREQEFERLKSQIVISSCELEKKYDGQFRVVLEAIRELMQRQLQNPGASDSRREGRLCQVSSS